VRILAKTSACRATFPVQLATRLPDWSAGGLLRCSAARLSVYRVVLQLLWARHPRLFADIIALARILRGKCSRGISVYASATSGTRKAAHVYAKSRFPRHIFVASRVACRVARLPIGPHGDSAHTSSIFFSLCLPLTRPACRRRKMSCS